MIIQMVRRASPPYPITRTTPEEIGGGGDNRDAALAFCIPGEGNRGYGGSSVLIQGC